MVTLILSKVKRKVKLLSRHSAAHMCVSTLGNERDQYSS